VNSDQYLITGCNDRELRVWKISFLDNKKIEYDANVNSSNPNEENEESIDTDMVHICIYIYYICFIEFI